MLTLCKSANIINNAKSFGCPPEILGSGAVSFCLRLFYMLPGSSEETWCILCLVH